MNNHFAVETVGGVQCISSLIAPTCILNKCSNFEFND